MPISTTDDLLRILEQLRLLTPARQRELIETRLAANFPDPRLLARELLKRDWLTAFQINQLFRGQGDTLRLGPYVLFDRIGEGGMGAVYKALQTQLERVVALKVIRKERVSKPEIVGRFQREARAAAQLQHPNVVTVHDAGEEAGTLFLVMEFIEGIDLSKLVKAQGPLPVMEACEYVRQAALGLEHIRQRGLVHRDIKPANLLVAGHAGQSATVKIADMGLARLLSATEGGATADGSMLGTPDFLAPEQAIDSHSVDIRADIYSLGCTLYYLLSGKVPFPDGSMAEKLLRHQQGKPAPLTGLRPDLPETVVALTERMMARKPEDRFQTPAEAALALTEVQGALLGGGSMATLPVAIPVAAPAGLAAPMALLAPAVAAVEQDTSSSMPTTDWKAQLVPAAVPVSPAPARPSRLRQHRLAMSGAVAGMGLLVLLLVLWQPWGGAKEEGDNDEQSDGNTEKEEPIVWRPGMKPVEDPFPPGLPVERGRDVWFGLADRPAPVAGATRWQLFRRMNGAVSPEGGLTPSPDGRLVAVVHTDFSVGVHDTETGKLTAILPGETHCTALAWAPQGRWLAVADIQGRIRFWDTHTGAVRRVILASERPIQALAWAADGRRVAARVDDIDLPLSIWDAGTGKRALRLQSLPREGRPGWLLAWSPDGAWLAVSWAGPGGNQVRLWDAEEGKPGPVLKDLEDEPRRMLWSNDSKQLIVAGLFSVKLLALDGKVQQQIDTDNVNAPLLAQDPGTGNLIWIERTPDGKQYQWRLWDRSTGKTETRSKEPVSFLPGYIWYRAGTLIGGMARGFDFRLFLVPDGSPVAAPQRLPETFHTGSLAWAPDGSVVSAIGSGTIHAWRAQDGKRTLKILPPGGAVPPRAFAWAPDGKRLMVGAGQALRLYRPWENPDAPLLAEKARLWIDRLVWSSDGKQVIVEGENANKNLEVWDAEKFERVRDVDWLSTLGHWVSPDGRWVAMRTEKEIQVWDLAQKKMMASWEHKTVFSTLAWGPDSRRLTTPWGSGAGVWEVPSGKHLGNVTKLNISSLALSGDGKALAATDSSSSNGLFAVRVWDPEADQERAVLGRMEQSYLGMAWSPQAPLLAGCDQHSLRVWDVKRPGLLWRMVLLPDGKGASIGEDGQVLQADPGAEDELVYVVELPDGSLRMLTPAEFRKQHPPRQP